jgi:cytochrome P450
MTEEDEAQAAREFVALQQLMAGYVRARRSAPTGDLISEVAAAFAPGDGELSFDQEAEIVGSLAGTVGAGHITTTDTIGSAVRLLLGHPDQWALLRGKPELIPGAVEEIMRFDSPVPTIFRLATREVTIGGVTVPEGADVLLAFASANRDESRFEDPDRFDVTRPPTRHFGFGAGVHTCVGALLARTQTQIALRVLGERLPDLQLVPDQTIRIQPSINVRGPLSLQLRW